MRKTRNSIPYLDCKDKKLSMSLSTGMSSKCSDVSKLSWEALQNGKRNGDLF